MSLNDLTKEQKQYVALGLLAASIVVILMVLGIRFSMATVSVAKEELDDLSGKINKANRALSRSRQTGEEYVKTGTELRSYLTNAPPERNYYSWATEVIYSMARFADLEIDSIDEVSIPQRKRSGSGDSAVVSFESYSLRIMAHGGYENTKYFLNLLNQDYPLVRFSGVEISSGQNRDKHNVQLFIQWPFNFGEISKNWDALESSQVKAVQLSAAEEPAVLNEPEPEPEEEPVASIAPVARPNSVREPYPPTTRPEVKEIPVPEPMAEPIIPDTQPDTEAEPQVASSDDVAPNLASDEELEAILSNVAPAESVIMDTEPQGAITEPEPMSETAPASEKEAIVAGPQMAMETAVVSDRDTEPAIEQEGLPLINESGMHNSASAPAEPPFDAMEAEPQIDAPPAQEIDSAPELSAGSQSDSVADETGEPVSTDTSEKKLEESLNQESAEEDTSLSSLLEDMMGKNNEK